MPKKLSKNQIEVINTLKKYKNSRIMFDGYLTGDVGVKLKMNTVKSLERIGIIDRGQLTEKGLSIEV